MEWLIGALIIVCAVELVVIIRQRVSRVEADYKYMLDREEQDRKIENLKKFLDKSQKNFKTAHALFDEIADQRDAAHDKIAELEKELDNKTADKKIS